MSNVRKRYAKPRRHAGTSFVVPGVREYLARQTFPLDFTDPDSDEQVVIEWWLLPNDAAAKFQALLPPYDLDAMNNAAVRVDPDETTTLLDLDDPAARALHEPVEYDDE